MMKARMVRNAWPLVPLNPPTNQDYVSNEGALKENSRTLMWDARDMDVSDPGFHRRRLVVDKTRLDMGTSRTGERDRRHLGCWAQRAQGTEGTGRAGPSSSLVIAPLRASTSFE